MSPLRRTTAVVLALLAPALLHGCGGGDTTATTATTATTPTLKPIRLGTKDFTEQFILGELYRQALEAKGFKVDLKLNVGSSEITHRALSGGGLDMYPEYVGVLLSEIAHVRDRASPDAAYERAKAFEEKSGFTLLEPTPFTDSNALAVKPAFARRHRLRTIADLKRLPGRVRIGAKSEFRSRFEGLLGLKQIYKLRNLSTEPLTGADRYSALQSGKVDVASVFTTEGQLANKRRYRVLDDPSGVFAAQHLAPVIATSVLKAYGPDLAAAINAVSRVLTTPAMQRMNAAVDIRHREPAVVAAEFLRARGLG